MTKTMAKKKREHLVRTTGRDVTSVRGVTTDFSTHERKTKTKHEKLNKIQSKHKKRYLQNQHSEDNAFYYE
jgi:hypothetical protein